ncbi:MAG: sensor histidine kinase [Myxococcota bacterium]
MEHPALSGPAMRAMMRAYPGGAIVIYDTDARYIAAGGQGLEAAGLTTEQLVGRGPIEVFGPGLGAAVQEHYIRCLAGWQGSDELTFRGRVYEVIQEPIRSESGAIIAGLTITVDVTDDRARDDERRSFEEQYRVVMERLPGAVYLIDADRRYRLAAGQALTDQGFDPQSLIGLTMDQVLSGPGLTVLLKGFDQAMAGTEAVVDVESQGQTFQTRWKRVDDVAGVGPAAVCITVDVSEQRAASAKLEANLGHVNALLREVHHRVKNNLQVVHSLLSVTARRVDSEEARASLRDVRDRVFAMSSVHTLLYQSEDLDSVRLDRYFRRLVHELIKGLPELNTVELVMELDPVVAGAELSLNLALILTELVSNAAKHGVTRGRGTVLGVRLRELDSGLVMSVWDDGPGLPQQVVDGVGEGMGMWVVRTLLRSVGGALTADVSRGTRWTVRIDESTLTS